MQGHSSLYSIQDTFNKSDRFTEEIEEQLIDEEEDVDLATEDVND